MHQNNLVKKLRYKFDNLMSKGPIAMIALLGILSLLVIMLAGFVIWIFNIAPDGEDPLNFIEGSWQSLMRTLDAGTMGGDAGWGFRIIAFLVTLGGIFIISTLIGVLSSGIEGKLEELRKGKSFVIEENHTLILGWSSKIFTIISELIIANENQKKPRIVILADKDKVEMEDEIRMKIPKLKNTKIICRSGTPNNLDDLNIANPQQAKSIIILAAEEENSDPLTIKTILAITNNPNRKKDPYHIVAEVKNEKNIEAAKMIGKDEVELILTDDIIGKIMVQTARQSGLSIVYTELMDFDGAEIYFNEEENLFHKTYGDAIFAYEESAVIGLQLTDGSVKINPPMDLSITPGTKIIAISEDDDTLIVSKKNTADIKHELIKDNYNNVPTAERLLLLGWNKRALIILKNMDDYVGSGSYMKVVSSFAIDNETFNELKQSLKNIQLEFEINDTTSRAVIDGLNICSYDSVQLLCYKDEMDIQDADAQTLITLLHIRRIMDEKQKDIKVVSEMLDIRNRDLAEVTKADDFIVSDKIISLLMTQVSENKYLMRVFEDLFNPDGSEIYLKPISNYVQTGATMDFYTVLESAKQKGHTAIGYRIGSLIHDSNKAHGVVVNPNKSDKITFSNNDMLIVLSEN
jgi:hypothetical protein